MTASASGANVRVKTATTAADGTVTEVAIGWGLFINAVIVFVIVALVVYLISKMFIKEAPPPGPTAEETLLTEIRDELRKRPS